jgi:hypothetical protein
MHLRWVRVITCCAVLALALSAGACGGSSTVDPESENVGPGPQIARISHGGITGYSFLPYWGLYVEGVLFTQGSNLLENAPINVALPGVPVGSNVAVLGYDLQINLITQAEGFLGPMGVVLQMP